MAWLDLCTNDIAPWVCQATLQTMYGNPNYTRTQLPIVKSALQKCIRRCEPKRASRIASGYLLADATGLLRRLSIIMVEDCGLFSSFATIIWAMVVWNKTSNLPLAVCLGMIDIVTMLATTVEDGGWPYVRWAKRDIDTPPGHANKVALKIRCKYGGMKGDMRMLREVKHEETGEVIPHVVKKSFKGSLCKFQRFERMPLVAVDFHCRSWILKALCQTFPDVTEDQMKSAMWQCRSGVRLKAGPRPVPVIVRETYARTWQEMDRLSQLVINRECA